MKRGIQGSQCNRVSNPCMFQMWINLMDGAVPAPDRLRTPSSVYLVYKFHYAEAPE